MTVYVTRLFWFYLQPFINEFHEFYCHVFVDFNRKWEAQPYIGIMEFPNLFAALKKEIEMRIDRKIQNSGDALFFTAAEIFE